MITGKVNIGDNNYTFTFENFELTIYEYGYLIDFNYSYDEFAYMKQLKAECYNSMFGNLIFIVNGFIRNNNGNVHIKILGYIESYEELTAYDKIAIFSDELDSFYNIRNAYSYSYDSNGNTKVSITPFDK